MSSSSKPEVIVIGGGVIGLSCAYYLAKERVRVLLLESGRCGAEASWASAGILAPGNFHRADPLVKILRHSLNVYGAFCRELREASGIDPEYDRLGAIEVLFDDQKRRMALSDERKMDGVLTEDGEKVVEVLSVDELADFEPSVTGECLGARLSRWHGAVRNPRLLKALVACCEKLGVDIRTDCPARGLTRDTDRVTGVDTEKGRLRADFVVLCAGAWSASVDEKLNDLTPTCPVRGQALLLRMDAVPFKHIVEGGKGYLNPRRDGHVVVGSTVEPEAGFENRNTADGVHRLLTQAVRLVPAVKDAELVRTWSGLRPGSEDNRPYLGPVPGHRGLIAATGHYRSGLALAPVTAEIVCDLVFGREIAFDLSRCQPGRGREQTSAK